MGVCIPFVPRALERVHHHPARPRKNSSFASNKISLEVPEKPKFRISCAQIGFVWRWRQQAADVPDSALCDKDKGVNQPFLAFDRIQ
jgi:hypothetical protein